MTYVYNMPNLFTYTCSPTLARHQYSLTLTPQPVHPATDQPHCISIKLLPSASSSQTKGKGVPDETPLRENRVYFQNLEQLGGLALMIDLRSSTEGHKQGIADLPVRKTYKNKGEKNISIHQLLIIFLRQNSS